MLQINDLLLGDWTFGYDTLNRLASVLVSSGPNNGSYGCWKYDAFGNRTLEAISTATVAPCAPQANDNAIFTPLTPVAGTNRMSNFTYDGAGDVLYDGVNAYGYDAEGRVCEIAVNLTGSTSYYQYFYDAEGRRVAKGSTTSTSCGAPTGANNFSLTNQYLLGLKGEQVTELAGASGTTPAHTNVWTSGNQLNTYDFVNGGLHFSLDDLVGTKRIQISGTGIPELVCDSLPFGNGLGNPRVTQCSSYGSSTAPDATEHHYTGKERDTESGLDYFGARYYASTMGRWTSPDWSDPAQPVPYANLDRPQSLNLYSYVENNPLSQIDDDGHSTVIFDGQAGTITVRANDGTETSFPASNNPQMSLTIGKLVDGNYAFLDTQRPHHHSPDEDSHNGAYGPGGIFRLKPFKGADGKEHDGVGLHAGRADMTDRAGRSGCNYATNGCVRTTEQAISFIMNLRRWTHSRTCKSRTIGSPQRMTTAIILHPLPHLSLLLA